MDKVMEFAKKLNNNEFLNNIRVPVLDNFKIVPNDGTLFTAINEDGYVEQFILDGVLDENESFDKHIDKVILETKKAMKKSGIEDVDNSFTFCTEYNGEFNFKIYIQDNILDGKIIRQFNVYFMDFDSRAFYEITLSSCPYALKDIESFSDELDVNMLDSVLNILQNIK